MRERLIKLLDYLQNHPEKTCPQFNSKRRCEGCKYDELDDCKSSRYADYLLENGVVLLPCKVGQTVYVVDKRLNVWWQGEVDCVYCNKNSFEYGILFDNDEYGVYNEEDLFFTKEEAERALKGGEEE